jgi:Ca-activated chloride channel homolog
MMIEQAGWAVLRPLWLLALPLVAVLTVMVSRHSGALGGWRVAIDPHLMAALERLGRVVPGQPARTWPAAGAAGLIALALAGPAKERQDAPSYRNLDGLVLVVDLSPSVAQGGRLTQAVTAARLVADRGQSRPVALIVYAGDAYLASAFTTDARALGTTLAVLDGETIPDEGSRPERALRMAREILAGAQIIAGDVVLITDGGGLSESAMQEARSIRAAGSRVSTIYVEPSILPAGVPQVERAALDAVAETAGGLAGHVLDPFPVAEVAGVGTASRVIQSDLVAFLWTDYGRYGLVFSLLPALALFRRAAR